MLQSSLGTGRKLICILPHEYFILFLSMKNNFHLPLRSKLRRSKGELSQRQNSDFSQVVHITTFVIMHKPDAQLALVIVPRECCWAWMGMKEYHSVENISVVCINHPYLHLRAKLNCKGCSLTLSSQGFKTAPQNRNNQKGNLSQNLLSLCPHACRTMHAQHAGSGQSIDFSDQ